jgi:acetylornithine deacetylase
MSQGMPEKPAADASERTAYLALAEELIRHDTISSRSNLGLIEAIRDHLRAHDVEALLVYDRCRQKANLFATLPAIHGETNGGVVLSGHTDVVPVTGQRWSSGVCCVSRCISHFLSTRKSAVSAPPCCWRNSRNGASARPGAS